MARKVKCPTCDKLNPRDEVVNNNYNNRYYCDDCFKKKMDKVNEVGCTKQDYNDLYDYIELMYGRKPDGQIFQQIKKYKEEYDYTYEWMLLTLQYVFEIEKLPIQEDSGIGIVPYFYHKAQVYYNRIWDIMDKNDTIELIKLKKEPKKVDVNWNNKNK